MRRYSNYCKLQVKATAAIRELKKTSKFSNFSATCRKNPACRGMELTVPSRCSPLTRRAS